MAIILTSININGSFYALELPNNYNEEQPAGFDINSANDVLHLYDEIPQINYAL